MRKVYSTASFIMRRKITLYQGETFNQSVLHYRVKTDSELTEPTCGVLVGGLIESKYWAPIQNTEYRTENTKQQTKTLKTFNHLQRLLYHFSSEQHLDESLERNTLDVGVEFVPDMNDKVQAQSYLSILVLVVGMTGFLSYKSFHDKLS